MKTNLIVVIIALAATQTFGAALPIPISFPPLTSVSLITNELEAAISSVPGLLSYGSSLSHERVYILPYSIRELNSNDEPTGTDIENHFNYIYLNETVWTLGNIYTTDLEGVRARAVNLTTTLQNDALVIVTYILYEEDGVISSRLDQYNITAGALKMNLEIRNWTFCDDKDLALGCLSRAEYLEVDFAIKGFLDHIEQISNTTFWLGEMTYLFANWESEVDSEIRIINQDGYPVIIETNITSIFPTSVHSNFSSDLLRVRFPRFDDYVTWDLIVY